jgi:hypothetical protein
MNTQKSKNDKIPNTQKPKQQPKFKISFTGFDIKKWNQGQKILVATVATLLIFGIFLFGLNLVTNTEFRNSLLSLPKALQFNSNSKKIVQDQIQELDGLINQYKNEADYYREYSINDLDIYPTAWVERNFSSLERQNQLISGPAADPDSDGLTNKQEYFIGSNPKKAFSLCDGFNIGDKPIPTAPFSCDGRNDKALYEAGLSPLTGLDLDIVPKFKILNQDFSIINSLKESVETASREGVDLPELYQRSRLIDLASVMDSQPVTSVEDNATNILTYRDSRIGILQDFFKQDSLTVVSQVYSITKAEQFDNVISQYQGQVDNLAKLATPKKYTTIQKANLLLFKKLIELYQLRKSYFVAKKSESQEFKDKSKEKSIEVIWAYRRLNEEEKKVE